MAITLSELRSLVRLRADNQVATDAELDAYLNGSLAELHDLLVKTYEDYYLTGPTSSTIANGGSVTLPADFHKLRGVDWYDGGEWRPLRPFNFEERARFTNASAPWRGLAGPDRRYRLTPSSVAIYPEESNAGTYRIWYVPRFQNLAADDDETSDLQHWEEYAVLDVAIKLMAKEESDASVFLAQKAALKQRIVESAPNRDAAGPARVVDVDAAQDDWW